MRPLFLLAAIFTVTVLTAGCPDQPVKDSSVYSEPAGARDRADKAFNELDKEMQSDN